MEFSKNSYENFLLSAVKHEYKICGFSDGVGETRKTIILRHDVDFSLKHAVELAELEASMGISSTYYILASSIYYSLNDAVTRAQLKRLIELGHEIGLHWQLETKHGCEVSAIQDIRKQKTNLEQIAQINIKTVSQHQPTQNKTFNLSALSIFDAYDFGLIPEFEYVSDSSMQWRMQTPLKLLEKHKSIYFLSHPIWWVSKGEDAATKLKNTLSKAPSVKQSEIKNEIENLKQALKYREVLDTNFNKSRVY